MGQRGRKARRCAYVDSETGKACESQVRLIGRFAGKFCSLQHAHLTRWRSTRGGYVYVVTPRAASVVAIKIGFTWNVEKRVSDLVRAARLATGDQDFSLEVLAFAPGTRFDEVDLHRVLDIDRHPVNEWFWYREMAQEVVAIFRGGGFAREAIERLDHEAIGTIEKRLRRRQREAGVCPPATKACTRCGTSVTAFPCTTCGYPRLSRRLTELVT